jgi:hypothetical protein
MSEPDPETSIPSLPTGQRRPPPANRLAKETSEKDLWDFDPDEEAPPQQEEEPLPILEPEAIPKPRFKAPKAVERSPRPLPASNLEDGEPAVRQPAVGRLSQRNAETTRRSMRHDDIGDLDETEDAWEEEPAAEQEQEHPADPVPEVTTPTAVEDEGTDSEASEKVEQEFSEIAQPRIDTRPMRERLVFTKIEIAGLAVLVAALIGTGIFLLTASFGHISTRSERAERPDYPIKGKLIRILGAETYWREPIRSGPNAETVRRETQLVPVLRLELEGGPCAIRAFFRDDKGEFVGDGVTSTASTGTLEIAATAGFEDLGAHAAYRTGETRPWKIEIFEAPSVDSSRQDFKKLLDLSISNDRR